MDRSEKLRARVDVLRAHAAAHRQAIGILRDATDVATARERLLAILAATDAEMRAAEAEIAV